MRLSKKYWIMIAITLFWLTLMGLLIQQEYFPKSINTSDSSYSDVLKDLTQDLQRRMTIYYGNFYKTKVGYLNTTIMPQLDRTTDISTYCQLSIPIKDVFLGKQLATLFGLEPNKPGEKFEVELQTTSHIGPDKQLKELTMSLKTQSLTISAKGNVRGRNLLLDVSVGEQKKTENLVLPIGSMAADPLSGPGKFPKLDVGKKLNMRWFDPISQQSRTVVAEVKGREEIASMGRLVSTYVVRLNFPLFSTTAWVDETGDILKYQIFLFTLVKEEDLFLKKTDTPN